MTVNVEKSGEQTAAELSDTAENNTITHKRPVQNRQDETQAIALLSSFGSHILYRLKLFPEQQLMKQIELKSITEGLSLKTIFLKLKNDLTGTLQKSFT